MKEELVVRTCCICYSMCLCVLCNRFILLVENSNPGHIFSSNTPRKRIIITHFGFIKFLFPIYQ